MFGKGVYFADSASKSAHYTDIGEAEKIEHKSTERFLILADVAVGETFDVYHADYEADLKMRQDKKLSVKGIGKYQIRDEIEFKECKNLETHHLNHVIFSHT